VSSTSHGHERVRSYLRELDAALRGAPAGKARELREQITAHLDDAIAPDADAEHITEVLDRLGAPADLAADVTRPVLAPSAAVGLTGAWLRRRLAQVLLRTWIVLAITAVLLGTAAGYLIAYAAPNPLQFDGESRWWYYQDWTHARDTFADNGTQSTVPDRPGQRQGLYFGIYNPTGVTQTVLGPGNGINGFWDSLGTQPGQIRVSAPKHSVFTIGGEEGVKFVLPGAIPPHQYRFLRVIWISNSCIGAGGGVSFDELALRVRVGWFVKIETIPLGQAWGISGTSHLNCPLPLRHHASPGTKRRDTSREPYRVHP
jgi:hypothetical protein